MERSLNMKYFWLTFFGQVFCPAVVTAIYLAELVFPTANLMLFLDLIFFLISDLDREWHHVTSTSTAFRFNEPQEFEGHCALFLTKMDQPAWKKLAAFPIRFNISSLAKYLPCIFHYSDIFPLNQGLISDHH